MILVFLYAMVACGSSVTSEDEACFEVTRYLSRSPEFNSKHVLDARKSNKAVNVLNYIMSDLHEQCKRIIKKEDFDYVKDNDFLASFSKQIKFNTEKYIEAEIPDNQENFFKKHMEKIRQSREL